MGLESRIDKYFKSISESNKKILNELILWSYADVQHNKDLYHLGEILPPKYLMQLISYFDGETIKLPTKKEYEDHLFLILVYYLRKQHGFSWKDVKIYLDITKDEEKRLISPISTGKKLLKLQKRLDKRLENILENMTFEDIRRYNKERKSTDRIAPPKEERDTLEDVYFIIGRFALWAEKLQNLLEKVEEHESKEQSKPRIDRGFLKSSGEGCGSSGGRGSEQSGSERIDDSNNECGS